jgi:predicted kinase
MSAPRLIVMAGLPCSGKSTLAEALGARLAIGVLATDVADAALRRAGVAENAGPASYLVVEALADAQLRLGCSVIVDAVNPVEPARQMWRDLAARRGARLSVIECVCADEALHRARVETRVRAIPGLKEVSWPHVLRREASYDSWADARLVLETSHAAPKTLLEAALTYIEATG